MGVLGGTPTAAERQGRIAPLIAPDGEGKGSHPVVTVKNADLDESENRSVVPNLFLKVKEPV